MTTKHFFIFLLVTVLLIGCGNEERQISKKEIAKVSTTKAPSKPPTAVMFGDGNERIDLHFYPSIQESEEKRSEYFFEDPSDEEIEIRQGVRIFSDDNSKIEEITGILGVYSESLKPKKSTDYIAVYLLRRDNYISTLCLKMHNGKTWYASIYTNSPFCQK